MARPALILALVLGRALAAQSPPASDIWLAELAPGGLGVPVNVTARPGYDNQPAFLPDGRGFYYTAIDADGQADVWHYDLATARRARVTATPESEYSPTPLPDGSGFSVVRVERDSTQRLWRFAPDGTAPRLVLEHVRAVGYHAWADAGIVVLFIVGQPHLLVVADVATGRADTVARDIGRALARLPGRAAVSFVLRVSPEEQWLAEVDGPGRAIRRLVRMPAGAEFHAWTPDCAVLAAAGTMLHAWRPGDDAWREVADLGPAGLRDVTRLAVSPDSRRLAIVAIPHP
jgi:dipeptidyl aminopeptidase/acylaminoacyl peptidase